MEKINQSKHNPVAGYPTDRDRKRAYPARPKLLIQSIFAFVTFAPSMNLVSSWLSCVSQDLILFTGNADLDNDVSIFIDLLCRAFALLVKLI